VHHLRVKILHSLKNTSELATFHLEQQRSSQLYMPHRAIGVKDEASSVLESNLQTLVRQKISFHSLQNDIIRTQSFLPRVEVIHSRTYPYISRSVWLPNSWSGLCFQRHQKAYVREFYCFYVLTFQLTTVDVAKFFFTFGGTSRIEKDDPTICNQSGLGLPGTQVWIE